MRRMFNLHKLIGPSEPVPIYIYVTHQNFTDGVDTDAINFLFPGITTVLCKQVLPQVYLLTHYLNFDSSWFHCHFLFS